MEEVTEQEKKKQEYNNIPVYFCSKCLSLKVMAVPSLGTEFCDKCGSTDISIANIETWKKLYRERYGIEYLETF